MLPKWIKIVLLIILLLSIVLMVRATILRDSIEWDESVNIAMGKHLFTGGEIGFWEDQRPPLLPIVFGVLWVLGLEPFIAGKILMLLTALVGIYLVYLITKELMDKDTALIATTILVGTTIFIHHSNNLMSNIPSAVIGLAAIYFFIKKQYLLTGLFAGLAFITRFTQGVVLIGIIIAFAFTYFFRKKQFDWKKVLNFVVGYAIVTIPFFVINIFFFSQKAGGIIKGALWPLGWASAGAAKGASYLFMNSQLFYLNGLLGEFLFALFIIPAIYFYFKNKKWKNANLTLVFATLLTLLIYYLSVVQNTLRYMNDFFLYLVVICSFGFASLHKNKSRQKLILGLVALILLIASFTTSAFEDRVVNPVVGRDFSIYNNYTNKTNLWLAAEPYAGYFTNAKIIPAFTTDRFWQEYNKRQYDIVLYVPDSLVCHDVYYSNNNFTGDALLRHCEDTKARILYELKADYSLSAQHGNEYFFTKD